MVKLINCLLFLSLTIYVTAQPCIINGDVTLSSQADVNDFVAANNACTSIHIMGGLGIGASFQDPSDIDDLSGLSNITTVDGGLAISFTDLTNLNGLQNITSIGPRLDIEHNSSLINIDDLIGVNSSISFLLIQVNPLLRNLNGLSNVAGFDTYFQITTNEALTDFCGVSDKVENFRSSGLYFLFGNAYNPQLRSAEPDACLFSEPEPEPEPRELALMPTIHLFLFGSSMIVIMLTLGRKFM